MAQGRDTFVCDLTSSIILCTSELYSWYVNSLKRYDHPQFWTFNDLAEHVCDALHMVWWLELKSEVQYVTFNFHTRLYVLHKTNSTTSVMSMVNKDHQALLVQSTK